MPQGVVLVLKVLAVYAASVLASAVVLGGIGVRAGPHPAEGMIPGGAALPVVHAITVAVMLTVVGYASVRGLALAVLLFVVLFGTQTAMMQIETLAFNRSVGMPLRDVGVVVLAGAVNAAAIAWVAARLFRGSGGGVAAPPDRLALRLAATSLAYVACYFAAGEWIAWSHAAVRDYYGQGIGIDHNILVPFQLLRGLLWSLIALFLALRLRGPHAHRVAILTVLFPLLTAPLLLYPNSYMPLAVAKAHFIEMLVSEAVWGLIAGLLLSPKLRR